MADLIDRQALLRDIEKYHLSDGKFQHWVEVQPSVEAEPVRHGRWIKHDVVKMLYDGRTLDGFVTCNKCQSVYALDAMEWAFCPICGSHNWEGQYN